MRTRGLWLVAALVAIGASIGADVGVIVARSASATELDAPAVHPAEIFPTTWNESFNDASWHAGGRWRIRDSATTSPRDLGFDFRLHWPFRDQEFVVVAKCDRGEIHFLQGGLIAGVPCNGTFREAWGGGGMPPVIRVKVDRPQRLDWGVAVYSLPV